MRQRFFSEFFGTAFLLCIVVGSGIMGDRLSGGNAAIALLANSIATGAGLLVLIQCLGSVSGAHFNPVVSLVEMLWGRLKRKEFFLYIFAQFTGALLGVLIAHVMFQEAVLQISQKDRANFNLYFSEFIATFGLISTIFLAGKKHIEFAPLSIASYITAAYWFTSSTSFANPAATFARIFTNSFCGINPAGALQFMVAQVIGSIAAFYVVKFLRFEKP